jgi:hypothetical protein
MLRAQEELYHLLSISTDDTKRRDSRSQSLTGPIRHSRHLSINIKSPDTRPVSAISTPGFSTPSTYGSARSNRFYDRDYQVN